jgi:RNA polymerase sigma factor for flagellar operon FliA
MSERRDPQALLLDNLPRIERVAASLPRRDGLVGADVEDFVSWVRLKLIEDDYKVLRKFRGESSVTTYLTVVIAMMYREHRVARWGRWRPSATARRMGPLAVRLETLVHRDGRRLDEAAEILHSSGETELGTRDLMAMLAKLPTRSPTRPVEVGPAPLASAAASGGADDLVVQDEIGQERSKADMALSGALKDLPAEDRLILQMRFWEGMSVADIGRGLGLPQKPLYRRIDRALGELRGRLEAMGVSAGLVRSILDESVV